MSSSQLLVTGATGSTGYAAVQGLQDSGNHVRALVHQDGPRADALRALGVEIVIGDLLDIDSVQAAMRDIDAAYFVFPLNPRLLDATAYFAQAAHEAGVGAIVNLSQRTARRDSKSHSAQNHWIAERIFDWSGIPVTHLRPTLFDEWLTYDFSIGAIIRICHIGRPWLGYYLIPYPSERGIWPNFRSPLAWDFFAISALLARRRAGL